MLHHVKGFPWKDLKKIPVWDCLACHSISFITLSFHGRGMSREVTSCHVTSKGKLGVANSHTPLWRYFKYVLKCN